MKNLLRCLLLLSGMMLSLSSAQAAEVIVAVAANFTAPMQKIAAEFEKDTGHTATLSIASTGKLYTQIKNGAPFHLLLAADRKTPELLEKEGFGIVNTRFTYAIGKLVLWSKQANRVDGNGQILKSGKFEHLALADPKLAPYGAAAIETLSNLGLLERLQPRFAQGENIAQTYQFIVTENAELGFVALSQVMSDGKITEGSAWLVPANLYHPIQQDMLVLTAGKDNPAALALAHYIRSAKSRDIIRAYGYAVPVQPNPASAADD